MIGGWVYRARAIVAVVAVFGGVLGVFWAGVSWEKDRNLERRLDAIKAAKEVENEVDTLDDDSLVDGIVRD